MKWSEERDGYYVLLIAILLNVNATKAWRYYEHGIPQGVKVSSCNYSKEKQKGTKNKVFVKIAFEVLISSAIFLGKQEIGWNRNKTPSEREIIPNRAMVFVAII